MARFLPRIDRDVLVTAAVDRTARIWGVTVPSGTSPLVVQQMALKHERAVLWAEFGPDGRRVVTASFDEIARVWDAELGEQLLALSGHKKWINTASFDSDGNWIVTASADGTARIWDAMSGKEFHTLVGHKKDVLHARFSPDGERVVTASSDYEAWIWDVRSGQKPLILEGHAGWVRSAEFSPDGKYVVTGGSDTRVLIWDAKSGELIRTLTGHKKAVRSVAFSPDGRLVVTASDDGTARIWDFGDLDDVWDDHTMRFWKDREWELASLRPGGDSGDAVGVRSAAFSPDGQRIVTTSADGAVWLWWCRTFENFTDLAEFAEKRTTKSEAESQGTDALSD